MLFSKKDLQKLIIPLMFEQLLAVSVGMVDTLMVSQAGEAAISGVALVDNINRLIIQVMAALATCVRRCYGQCSALFYGNIAVVPVFRHLQCGGCDI